MEKTIIIEPGDCEDLGLEPSWYVLDIEEFLELAEQLCNGCPIEVDIPHPY